MLTAIFDSFPAIVALLDPNGEIVLINSHWRDATLANGLNQPNHGIGLNILKICKSASGFLHYPEQVITTIQNVLQCNHLSGLIEYPSPSSEENHWYEIQITPLSFNGRTHCLLVHSDITDRKANEIKLKTSELRLKEAQRIAQMGNSIYFPETGVMEWSEETYRIMGFDPAQPVPSREEIFERIHPEDNRIYQPKFQNALVKGEGFEMDLRVVSPLTPTRWIRLIVNPQIEDDNKVRQISSIVMDITEHRLMEERLRHSQELESVGRLAGGVAHDFNNLLTAIEGYTEIALSELHPDNPVRNHLHQINRAATRAANLTHQLLSFAGKEVMQSRIIDLNDTVRQVQSELTQTFGTSVKFDSSLDRNLWRIKADPDRIQEAIREIAYNSREAMSDAGLLLFETSNISVDTEYEKTHPEVIPGNYVLLSISDEGEGIPLEIQPKIFDPFFTTNEMGKGHGLGLAVTYGIVKQHRGHIFLYSEPKRGATFKILFPRCEKAADASSALNSQPSETGVETILVLVREDLVRDITVTTLRSHGYTVLEAESCISALNILQKFQAPIKMLVSDTIFTDVQEVDIRRCLQDYFQGMRILHISAGSIICENEARISNIIVSHLEMPFTSRSLLRKVREVLDMK